MRTADLHSGMEVWVRLPYCGGSGWARVLQPRVRPEPFHRAATVRIAFLPGEGPLYARDKLVRPADVIKARP